jgi:hypothetical protein
VHSLHSPSQLTSPFWSAKKAVVTPDIRSQQKCKLPPVFAECVSASGNTDGEYWRWCPRCGHELHNEKCKFRCPHCHYFMSCSDFD